MDALTPIHRVWVDCEGKSPGSAERIDRFISKLKEEKLPESIDDSEILFSHEVYCWFLSSVWSFSDQDKERLQRLTALFQRIFKLPSQLNPWTFDFKRLLSLTQRREDEQALEENALRSCAEHFNDWEKVILLKPHLLPLAIEIDPLHVLKHLPSIIKKTGDPSSLQHAKLIFYPMRRDRALLFIKKYLEQFKLTKEQKKSFINEHPTQDDFYRLRLCSHLFPFGDECLKETYVEVASRSPHLFATTCWRDFHLSTQHFDQAIQVILNKSVDHAIHFARNELHTLILEGRVTVEDKGPELIQKLNDPAFFQTFFHSANWRILEYQGNSIALFKAAAKIYGADFLEAIDLLQLNPEEKKQCVKICMETLFPQGKSEIREDAYRQARLLFPHLGDWKPNELTEFVRSLLGSAVGLDYWFSSLPYTSWSKLEQKSFCRRIMTPLTMEAARIVINRGAFTFKEALEEFHEEFLRSPEILDKLSKERNIHQELSNDLKIALKNYRQAKSLIEAASLSQFARETNLIGRIGASKEFWPSFHLIIRDAPRLIGSFYRQYPKEIISYLNGRLSAYLCCPDRLAKAYVKKPTQKERLDAYPFEVQNILGKIKEWGFIPFAQTFSHAMGTVKYNEPPQYITRETIDTIREVGKQLFRKNPAHAFDQLTDDQIALIEAEGSQAFISSYPDRYERTICNLGFEEVHHLHTTQREVHWLPRRVHVTQEDEPKLFFPNHFPLSPPFKPTLQELYSGLPGIALKRIKKYLHTFQLSDAAKIQFILQAPNPKLKLLLVRCAAAQIEPFKLDLNDLKNLFLKTFEVDQDNFLEAVAPVQNSTPLDIDLWNEIIHTLLQNKGLKSCLDLNKQAFLTLFRSYKLIDFRREEKIAFIQQFPEEAVDHFDYFDDQNRTEYLAHLLAVLPRKHTLISKLLQKIRSGEEEMAAQLVLLISTSPKTCDRWFNHPPYSVWSKERKTLFINTLLSRDPMRGVMACRHNKEIEWNELLENTEGYFIHHLDQLERFLKGVNRNEFSARFPDLAEAFHLFMRCKALDKDASEHRHVAVQARCAQEIGSKNFKEFILTAARYLPRLLHCFFAYRPKETMDVLDVSLDAYDLKQLPITLNHLRKDPLPTLRSIREEFKERTNGTTLLKLISRLVPNLLKWAATDQNLLTFWLPFVRPDEIELYYRDRPSSELLSVLHTLSPSERWHVLLSFSTINKMLIREIVHADLEVQADVEEGELYFALRIAQTALQLERDPHLFTLERFIQLAKVPDFVEKLVKEINLSQETLFLLSHHLGLKLISSERSKGVHAYPCFSNLEPVVAPTSSLYRDLDPEQIRSILNSKEDPLGVLYEIHQIATLFRNPTQANFELTAALCKHFRQIYPLFRKAYPNVTLINDSWGLRVEKELFETLFNEQELESRLNAPHTQSTTHSVSNVFCGTATEYLQAKCISSETVINMRRILEPVNILTLILLARKFPKDTCMWLPIMDEKQHRAIIPYLPDEEVSCFLNGKGRFTYDYYLEFMTGSQLDRFVKSLCVFPEETYVNGLRYQVKMRRVERLLSHDQNNAIRAYIESCKALKPKETPDEFLCGILFSEMKEPCTDCVTTKHYEQNAFMNWWKNNNSHPSRIKDFSIDQLILDSELQEAIQLWQEDGQEPKT